MRGTVKIGERDVDMLANGASPFIYKKIFHKDFLTTVGTNYIGADGKKKTDMDTNAIWISEFEPLDFAMAMTEIMGLYYQQQKTTVTQKKDTKDGAPIHNSALRPKSTRGRYSDI